MNAPEAKPFEPPKYLASLIAAVNDGAKAAQGGAFLFLLVGTYLLATAFSATDEDLLLGKTVTILQLGATLPVSFSFAIAPAVFVFLHIYTLVRYALLADNVHQFKAELDSTVPDENDRERCLHLLANVEFIVALSAPPGSRLHSRVWPWLFAAIIAIFPVATLLLVQINTVRYQSDLITWVQRTWLALDLIALGWFFARTPVNTRFRLHPRLLIALPALLLTLDVCWLSPVPPDADPHVVRYDRNDEYWNDPSNASKRSLAATLRSPLDLVLCPALNWGCRFLRVDHRTLVDRVWDDKAIVAMRAGGADENQTLASIEGVVLRDRSLRFVVVDESRLFAADLQRADLRGASLHAASLPGGKLMHTRLEGADLREAQLQNSDFSFARMQHADLGQARLREARLEGTQLQDACLVGAILEGSTLDDASLEGADLTAATLTGASLVGAEVDRANLVAANLQAASLRGASFRSAYLSFAHLEGAYSSRLDFFGSFVFFDAHVGIVGFQDADLAGARLDATDLASVDFRRATGNVNVSLADLRGAFSSQQSADTTQDMPGGFAGTPPIACQRNTQPTPPRSSLDFFARQSVLASDPPDPALANLAPADPALADPALADPALAVPALANHPDWLITTPSPAYVQALSDYLVGELAPSDPAAAQGIARRMALSIYDDETRPIAEPIACRLLATPALKLTKQSVDVLNTALKQAKITCPAAAVPAAPQ